MTRPTATTASSRRSGARRRLRLQLRVADRPRREMRRRIMARGRRRAAQELVVRGGRARLRWPPSASPRVPCSPEWDSCSEFYDPLRLPYIHSVHMHIRADFGNRRFPLHSSANARAKPSSSEGLSWGLSWGYSTIDQSEAFLLHFALTCHVHDAVRVTVRYAPSSCSRTEPSGGSEAKRSLPPMLMSSCTRLGFYFDQLCM